MLTEEENEEEEEVDVAPDILLLQKPRSAHVSVHNFTLCVYIYIYLLLINREYAVRYVFRYLTADKSDRDGGKRTSGNPL